MKQDFIKEAKNQNSWRWISDSKACQHNDEGIEPLGEGQTVQTSNESKDLCMKSHACATIDYYGETTYCLMYSEACTRPFADHNDAMSMKLRSVVEPTWRTISLNKACESSKEGVSPLAKAGGRKEESLEACKKACMTRLECIAVDYYKKTSWCNLYDEGCKTPLSTADG